jgi:hypothetical protein
MTIEQKPELNRFVDPSIPLTWKWRWRVLKISLPVWFFILASLLEIWLFKAWLSNDWHWDRLLIVLSTWLAMMFFILAISEFQARIGQRSKRVIEFKDDKIRVKPAKSEFIQWKKIAKFQFEPIPDTSDLKKLKLFLHGRPNQKRLAGRVFWAMVLENPSQVQEVLRCLQITKMEARADYEIETSEHPLLQESSARFPFLGMSLYMGGLFVLLHGGSLLLAVLNQGRHDSDADSKFTPEEIAKLGQLIAKHFSSKEEFRHFSLALGICLTVIGAILMIWGWWLMTRKKSSVESAN